ncbi:MAG: fimbria/pilus outer membrane usher protein [Pseudomonas sp.]
MRRAMDEHVQSPRRCDGPSCLAIVLLALLLATCPWLRAAERELSMPGPLRDVLGAAPLPVGQPTPVEASHAEPAKPLPMPLRDALAAGSLPASPSALPPPPPATAVVPAPAAEPAAESAPPADAAAGEYALFLELVVNELPSDRVAQVTVRGERYFVSSEDLLAVGVRLPEGASGEVALDSVSGLQFSYDQELQRLKLVLPSDWLPDQQLGARTLNASVPAQSSFGALLNYDAYYNDTEDGSHYLSAFLEQRAFGSAGVVSNTGVYRHSFNELGADQDGYMRYDTYWRYNNQETMTRYIAGDLITGALTWNSAVRLGGVQVSRNFALRPDLITYPLPRFTGEATVPTSVDLFINNAKVSSDQINPGPYTVSNVPYISGAGSATVVTTDALGRQVATDVPFYVTNSLLQKDLYDYSLSVGKLREDYGLKNFSYGSSVSSGTFRYGLSDWFTAESHAEVGEELRLGGLGATIGLGNYGTLSTSAVQSQYEEKSGQQVSAGYSYYSNAFGFGVAHTQRSKGFVDISMLSALEQSRDELSLAKKSDQLTFSFSPGDFGNVGVGYFASETMDGQRTRLLNLSWSRSLWGNSSVYVAANRDLDGEGYSAVLQLIIPFDVRSTFSASVERDTQGKFRERVNLGRTPPVAGGVGYNLGYATGDSTYEQADLTWRTPYAQVQGGVYRDDGRLTQWGDITGSVIAMDGEVFPGNQVDDAFVLVSTSGFADVPVSFEHQLIGKTNKSGHLLVPSVPSYYGGQYEIDPLGLPANIRTPVVEDKIAVHQGSGALLNFDLRRVVAASIVLIDSRGEVIPRGSEVTVQGTSLRAFVGWDGLVYFEGLGEQNQLLVTRPDGEKCGAAFALKNTNEEVSLVGPLTCR